MGTIEKYRFATPGYKMLLHEIFPCVAARAILGQTTEAWFYSTLNAAVNDVNAGTIGTNEDATEASAVACVFFEDGKPVVGLLKDTTETTRVQAGVDMTINLGGKELTFSNTPVGIATSSSKAANLTVDGRMKGSTVRMSNTQGSNTKVIQLYSGNCKIFGGTYVATASGAGTENSGNSSVLISGSANVNICGANFYITDNIGGYTYGVSNNSTGEATLYGCNIYADSQGGGCYGTYSVKGKTTIKNCNIVAKCQGNIAIGLLNLAESHTIASNCNIKAYSNCFAEGDTYTAYSHGVSNTGVLTIDNCYVMGTHSGIQNMGTLYVNGGTFESYGHGGIYFSGDNTTAYVRNATLKDSLTMPEGWEGTSQHNGAGFYIGGGSNENVYMDNCDIYGSAASQIFVIKTRNNALYVSNSTINNLKGGDTKIRIDGNNKMYLGIGNNFTAEDTNNPGNVIVTNEVYVQEVA